MYEKWSIFINILVILIMLLTVIVNIKRNNSSMFNYDFQIKFYILYILPLIFVVINICLNILFKLPIKFWIVAMSPIVIPLISYSLNAKKLKTDTQLYYKYNELIKVDCKQILETLNIKVDNEKIFIFINDDNDGIYCKIVIDYTIDTSNIVTIQKVLKYEMQKRYSDIKFDVIFEV